MGIDRAQQLTTGCQRHSFSLAGQCLPSRPDGQRIEVPRIWHAAQRTNRVQGSRGVDVEQDERGHCLVSAFRQRCLLDDHHAVALLAQCSDVARGLRVGVAHAQ